MAGSYIKPDTKCFRCRKNEFDDNGIFYYMKEARWVFACGFCISDLRAKIVTIHPLSPEEKEVLERQELRRMAREEPPQPPPRQPQKARKFAKWRDLRRGVVSQTDPPKFGALWPKFGRPDLADED